MFVSVLQEQLAKGLNIVSKAVDSRPTLPVLANVLLSTEDARLKLAATNLELTIELVDNVNMAIDNVRVVKL